MEICLQKFWPTPTEPHSVEITLNLRRAPETELQWEYVGEIRFGRETYSTVSRVGTFEAITEDEAKIKAYSYLVTKLGSLVADLITERDDYKRLLEAEKAKTQGETRRARPA